MQVVVAVPITTLLGKHQQLVMPRKHSHKVEAVVVFLPPQDLPVKEVHALHYLSSLASSDVRSPLVAPGSGLQIERSDAYL